jgi:hypothetical protein
MIEQKKRILEILELMMDTEILSGGLGLIRFHVVTVLQRFCRRTVLRV